MPKIIMDWSYAITSPLIELWANSKSGIMLKGYFITFLKLNTYRLKKLLMYKN